MWGLFSKTQTFRCPDGRPAVVYKHVNDALPLGLKDVTARGGMRGDAAGFGEAEVAGAYEASVSQIMFAINARNSSQVLDYRNAYLAYMSDPCGNREFLSRVTDRIMSDRAFLDRMQIRADTLIQLIRHSPESGAQIVELSRDIMTELSITPASVAAKEIDLARGEAVEMLTGPDHE
jgi:hypothetical protein